MPTISQILYEENNFVSRPGSSRPARVINIEFLDKYQITLNETLEMENLGVQTQPWMWLPPKIIMKLSEFRKNDSPNAVYQNIFKYETNKYGDSLFVYTMAQKQRPVSEKQFSSETTHIHDTWIRIVVYLLLNFSAYGKLFQYFPY